MPLLGDSTIEHVHPHMPPNHLAFERDPQSEPPGVPSDANDPALGRTPQGDLRASRRTQTTSAGMTPGTVWCEVRGWETDPHTGAAAGKTAADGKTPEMAPLSPTGRHSATARDREATQPIHEMAPRTAVDIFGRVVSRFWPDFAVFGGTTHPQVCSRAVQSSLGQGCVDVLTQPDRVRRDRRHFLSKTCPSAASCP